MLQKNKAVIAHLLRNQIIDRWKKLGYKEKHVLVVHLAYLHRTALIIKNGRLGSNRR